MFSLAGLILCLPSSLLCRQLLRKRTLLHCNLFLCVPRSLTSHPLLLELALLRRLLFSLLLTFNAALLAGFLREWVRRFLHHLG
jgi:hypothetical protein